RRQKDDGQCRRFRAQVAAQLETAFNVIAQTYINDRQIRQTLIERRPRIGTATVEAHAVALAGECITVVVGEGDFVFDDGDVTGHGHPLDYASGLKRVDG